MIRFSMRRIRTALVALTLTAASAGTAIAVAGPAAANGATCTPTATLTVNNKTAARQVVRYGDYVTVRAEVAANCTGGTYNPSSPLYGTLVIQRTTDGSNWSTVATGTSAGYASRYGTKVLTRISEFRAVYTGGADPNYGDTYADATSNAILVGIVRKSTETRSRCGRRSCKDTWRIAPAASIKGLTAQVQHRKDGKWRKAGHVRINSKGAFTYAFPVGTTRVVLPAKRGFLSSYVQVRVTIHRYRPATARVTAAR